MPALGAPAGVPTCGLPFAREREHVLKRRPIHPRGDVQVERSTATVAAALREHDIPAQVAPRVRPVEDNGVTRLERAARLLACNGARCRDAIRAIHQHILRSSRAPVPREVAALPAVCAFLVDPTRAQIHHLARPGQILRRAEDVVH
eukprot:3227713-Prymnesium_polylepis.2